MRCRLCRVTTLSLLLLTGPAVADAQPNAYITHLLDDIVSVINTVSNTVITTVPVGDGPEAVAVNSDNTRAYVANSLADTVSVINVASNSVVDTITVGDNPQGVAVSPSGFWVYVANNEDGNVSVIDTNSNTVVDTIAVGLGPLRAVVSGGGDRLYVTNAGDNNVSVVDTATNLEITTIPVGTSPAGLDVTPDRSRLYVANTNEPLGGGLFGTVSVINTGTNSVVKTINLEGAEAVAVTPDGDHVYVSRRFPSGVSLIDTATNTVTGSVTAGLIPRGLAITPDGNRVYVANSVGNSVTVIDTGTNTVVDTITVVQRPIAFGKFISPMTLLFADRFESGDTSKWSSTVGTYVGSLGVNGASAHTGNFGLEITLGATCAAPFDRAITSPPFIDGLFLGCNSITASGVQVASTGATFVAGSSLVLGSNFSVGSGSPFTAVIDPGLLSGLGYVEWASAGALASYDASFHLKLNDLSIVTGDLLELFNGYSSNGAVQFKVILKFNSTLTENRLVLSVRQDNGTYIDTPALEETLVPNGWNKIEVRWKTGSGTGSLTVSLNGGTEVGLSGIDNDLQRIDGVRLGYVGGSVTTTAGSIKLDDFWSQL